MIIKTFQAVVAVGVEGIALMSLKESLSNESPCDIEGDQVLEDIRACAIEDWFHYLPIDRPTKPDAYIVTGDAIFYMDNSMIDDVTYKEVHCQSMEELTNDQ